MKIWKAQEIYLGIPNADIKLSTALNKIQENGWLIEGVDYFGKHRDYVMILATIEAEKGEEVELGNPFDEPEGGPELDL